MGLIIRVKSFPYDLPFSYNTSITEDRWTDGRRRQTTTVL